MVSDIPDSEPRNRPQGTPFFSVIVPCCDVAAYLDGCIGSLLSQPFAVAEQFTGQPGKYVPLRETVRGFKEILEGRHDDLPENAFYMVGTIDEAVAKAEKLKEEA